jgi:hypothetical protein
MFGEVPVEIAMSKVFFSRENRLWMQIRRCLRLIVRLMRARMLGAQSNVAGAYNQ